MFVVTNFKVPRRPCVKREVRYWAGKRKVIKKKSTYVVVKTLRGRTYALCNDYFVLLAVQNIICLNFNNNF